MTQKQPEKYRLKKAQTAQPSERGYVSGNMFVYFSPNQVKNEDFRGPDVFVALGRSNHERKSGVIWEEEKVPDVVIELLSESTARQDKGKKKANLSGQTQSS